MNLDTPIQYLKGVGPKMAARLGRLGIQNVNDLIFYFPRDWDDLSDLSPISQLRIGNKYNIKATITKLSNSQSPRKRMNITTAVIKDDGGELRVVWFNQPFLVRNLKVGETWIFSGKVEWDFQSKSKTMVSPAREKNPEILSIYPETDGVTSKYLRRLIKTAYSEKLFFEEFLDSTLLKEEKLMELDKALFAIHFPLNAAELRLAKNRLAFNELFLISVRMIAIKKTLSASRAPKMTEKLQDIVKFTNFLPYKLTNAQRKSSWEIIKDLAKNVPMNRLLEGDVGSGKTVVAAMAALNVIKNHYQVVWMAPTEILAHQHYENVSELFKQFNIKIALLTSNTKISNFSNKLSFADHCLPIESSKKRSTKNATNDDKQKTNNNIQFADLIIGTHALIQDDIKFENLGLVIIDEQHRFGVKQRAKLRSVNNKPSAIQNSDLVPHFLSMTATPIPRTLALSLYGDLDISAIDEMPASRQKVITRLVDPTSRQKAYQFVKTQIENGRQVFVVCPLIEESSKSGVQNSRPKQTSKLQDTLFNEERKSVKKEYERLSKEIFPEFKISALHGKMKSAEKEKIMRDFIDKKIDILVSTSVIEVGIDVPNASVMIIEDADRFGLAQLHQFRGRVGRGVSQSYCLLFTSMLSPETNRRLSALVECSDGFKLAEKDLEIRGPGELSGAVQHGLPDLKMASLTDIILISRVRDAALKVTSEIEKYPALIQKLKEFESENHLE